MVTDLLRRLFARPARRELFMDDITTDGIEVLPASRREWVEREMTLRGGAPSERGWSGARVRRPEDGAETIADLGIPFEEACLVLSDRLARFDAVVTGNPNHPTPTQNARGFGPSPLVAVAIYREAGSNRVGWIELSLRGQESENQTVIAALAAIPSPEPILVVDWDGRRLAEGPHMRWSEPFTPRKP